MAWVTHPPPVATSGASGTGLNTRLPTVFVGLIILLNAQVFTKTAANPLGIKGAQEGFLALLILWAVAMLASQMIRMGGVRRLDLFVFLLIPAIVTYGDIMSKLTYGQPLGAGLMEERRVFSFWIYFPVMMALRSEWVDVPRLERLIVGGAIFCALLSVGVKIGVVPSINAIKSSEVALRGERVAVGQIFVAIAIPMIVARKNIASIPHALPSILFLTGVLLVVVQTRQILFGSFVATIYCLRGAKAALAVVMIGIGVTLALVLAPQLQDLVSFYRELLAQAFSQEYLTESWRGLSMGTVFEALGRGEIWGHGSLSPTWNEGFSRTIGPFFFLADIGVFGTAFRYGLVALAFYIPYLAVQTILLRGIDDRMRRVLYGGLFLMVVVMMPVSAPLEHRGYLTGLILAITGYLAQHSVQGGQHVG